MRVKLDEFALPPTRAHATDAGLDLYTPVLVTIPPNEGAAVDTGVHIELPWKHYGKIESKSGLNTKHGVVCCGGVIDEGYTGSIVVKLYNFGDRTVQFAPGTKIAQLIVQPCEYVEVEVADEISGGERGDNGFGSTGI